MTCRSSIRRTSLRCDQVGPVSFGRVDDRLHRLLGVSAGSTRISRTRKFDDLKGRTVVSPDPDSITAAMLRAMLRDQKFGSTDVKVITTRYQDAVPFYVEYGFAQAGATAAKSVAKSWTSQGWQDPADLAADADQAVHCLVQAVRRRRRKVRAVLTTLGQSDGGKHALTTLGYQGIRRAESRRRTEGDRLARPVRRRASGRRRCTASSLIAATLTMAAGRARRPYTVRSSPRTAAGAFATRTIRKCPHRRVPRRPLELGRGQRGALRAILPTPTTRCCSSFPMAG